MKCYAGLDVSLKKTGVCVIDEEGTIIREGNVPSEPEDIAARLREHAHADQRPGQRSGGTAHSSGITGFKCLGRSTRSQMGSDDTFRKHINLA